MNEIYILRADLTQQQCKKNLKKKKRKNEILIVEVTGITGARFSSRPWLKSMYKVSKCTENFLPNKITS